MYKKYISFFSIFSNIFFCIGQNSAPYEPVSIYEIGEAITNCDVNMKNLLRNWTPEKIANSDDYEFLEWSFIESISDSARYVYYRNYFSTNEPVYSSIAKKSGENKSGTYDSLWVYPGFLHPEYHDPRGLPDKAREILSKDFIQKALNLSSMELNIDTLDLFHHSYYRSDSTKSEGIDIFSGLYIKEKIWRSISLNIAT